MSATQPAPTTPIPWDAATALGESVLHASFSPEELERLFPLGEIVALEPGAEAIRAGTPSEFLDVILEGVLVPAAEGFGPPTFFVGPGDIVGEIGFGLGVPRTATLMALGERPRVWRVSRRILDGVVGERGVLGTRLLGAVARALALRLEEARAPSFTAASELDYCDPAHPAIASLAAKLARPTPFETACAIWDEVFRIPYRFGSWRWTAAETLARGQGMCTTKAVFQVALLRASGIEAGYVKTVLPAVAVQTTMPRGYHERFARATFKHYYAAARLDGRWVPFEASFTRAVMALIARGVPEVGPYVDWHPRDHGFANGIATLAGEDPYAIEVHGEMTAEMRKAASYHPKNAEAMNVLLDRAQGFRTPPPPHVLAMEQALAEGRAASARVVVGEGIARDVARLREMVPVRGTPA